MVEARSGLPESSPTLTLKKGVLEWKFWKACFSLKLIIWICNNFYFRGFFNGQSKRARKCQKQPNWVVFGTFWLFLTVKSKNSENKSCCKNKSSTLVNNELPQNFHSKTPFFNVKVGEIFGRPDLASTIFLKPCSMNSKC